MSKSAFKVATSNVENKIYNEILKVIKEKKDVKKR